MLSEWKKMSFVSISDFHNMFCCAVVFDPASFYGHHEYELAIAGMFGGFSASFYEAYHSHFPRSHGFDSRHKLYQLFHYLNHW